MHLPDINRSGYQWGCGRNGRGEAELQFLGASAGLLLIGLGYSRHSLALVMGRLAHSSPGAVQMRCIRFRSFRNSSFDWFLMQLYDKKWSTGSKVVVNHPLTRPDGTVILN